jgi:hypothetical protein
VDADTTILVKPQPAAVPSEGSGQAKPRDSHIWAGAEPSFHDILDAINPLHQIPVVSAIYENLTGDRIGIVPRIIGGAIFGGPIGMAAAMATGAFEDATGKTPGETVIALLTGDGGDSNPAAAGTAPPSVAVAEASAGKDRDGSLAARSGSSPPGTAAPVLVAEAGRGGGKDLDPTAFFAPAAPSPSPPPVGPVVAQQPTLSPQQRADQLAMEAAHQARFGKPGQPLLQQASLINSSYNAARGPARPPGVSSQRVEPLTMPQPAPKPATVAQPAPNPAPSSASEEAAEANQPADDSISKAMMRNLDKYQALLKQREAANGPPPGAQLDLSQ